MLGAIKFKSLIFGTTESGFVIFVYTVLYRKIWLIVLKINLADNYFF